MKGNIVLLVSVVGPKAVPSETADKAEVEAPLFAGKEAEPPWSTGWLAQGPAAEVENCSE